MTAFSEPGTREFLDADETKQSKVQSKVLYPSCLLHGLRLYLSIGSKDAKPDTNNIFI